MAAGYITPGDDGLPFNETTVRYVCMDMRLPTQPGEWESEVGAQRYRIAAWRQITLGAAVVSKERIHGWDATSSEDSLTGAKDAAWEEYDAGGQDPSEPTGRALGTSAFSSGDTEPRHAGNPLSGEAFLMFYASVADGELLALYFELENDNAFSTSTPSSTRDYETMGRNTVLWVPYEENMSVSAWLMQRILAQNYNKVLYESKQCWSVPL